MIKEDRFREPEVVLQSEGKKAMESLLLKKLRERLSQEKRIVFSYIFGSFARGEPFRDIDLAIYTKGRKELSWRIELTGELTTITGFPVEIITLNDALISIQMRVVEEGIVLTSRDEDIRTDFIEKTGKKYREYCHFRNLFLGIEGIAHKVNRTTYESRY